MGNKQGGAGVKLTVTLEDIDLIQFCGAAEVSFSSNQTLVLKLNPALVQQLCILSLIS